MPESPKLPPFGIRDLHGPLFDPGLIQISARAYDATLKSQPDATLLYVDDDDGEQITVGSALELSQRLDEPVQIREQDTRSTLKNPTDGKYIHVFDINKSSASVAVWRDHEAYSSKALRSSLSPVGTPTQISSSQPDVSDIASEQPLPGSFIHYDGASQDSDFLRRIFSEYGTVKSFSFNKGSNNLASGMVEFGDWTEAEIARCSLDAVHGLSVLRPTAAEMHQCHASASTPSSSSKPSSSDIAPTIEQSALSVNKDEPLRLDSDILLQGIEQHLSGLANVLTTAASTLQKAADKTKYTDTSVVEDILTGVKNILTEVGNFGLEAFKALETEVSSTSIWEPNQLSLATNDELTSSTDLAAVKEPAQEFSPPEAKPIEDVYPRVKFALDDSYSDFKSAPALRPTTSTPALRYTSLDQDVESELNMNPFASPKSSKAESILDDDDEDAAFTARYPPLMTVRRSQTVAGTSQKPRYQPYSRRFHSPEPSRYRLSPSVKRVEPVEGKKVTTEQPNLSDSVHHSLPGAWPEAKPDYWSSGLPTSNESSGSFFNRMTGRSSAEPSVKRSNTTAASNPASRLNGPFDPGFAYHTKQTTTSQVTANVEPDAELYGNLNRSRSDAPRYRRPRPIWAQSSRKQTSPSSSPPHQSVKPVSPIPSRPATKDPLEPFPPTFWRPPPPHIPFYVSPPAPRHHRSVPNVGHMFRHHPPPPPPPHLRNPSHVPAMSSAVPQPTEFPEWPALVPQPAVPFSLIPQASSPEPIMSAEPSTESSKYDTCVEQLKVMGFDRKINGEHVADRLHVYAVAADGDVSEAVEMINEDREAVKRLSVPSGRDYGSDSDDPW